MAHLAPNYEERQEFWKPVVTANAESQLVSAAADQVCQSCGTGYVLGSRFCHVCGADRHVNLADASAANALGDWVGIRAVLGQSSASLAAFILGIIFLIAAAVTGFLFTATTLLDWQAIQIWRIEWLLAATAVFIAGLLLRKK